MTNHLFDGLLAKGNPQRMFAKLPDGRYYSYQDVLDVSARFANTLVSLGLTPGDRVAVQVPKSIEALMLYLGTVRAGGVFLPLNTAYTQEEVAYFIEDASPVVVVCDPKNETQYKARFSSLTQVETLGVWRLHEESAGSLADAGLNASSTFETVSRSADDMAAILYTSGTTGRSKGAMLSHNNLLSNSKSLMEAWHFTEKDRLLHALPIFHTHGLFVATNVTLLAGGSLVLLPGLNMDQMIEYLPECTSLMGVPTFYTRLLDEPRFNRELVEHVRLFVSGSAPLLAETHVEFEERTGHRILERYGMTETNMNTSNPYEGERRAGTVGFPLPEVCVTVTDPESGSPVPEGEIGMIEVKGPNVFRGYWNMPEKTKEEFRDNGYFITGDLGQFDEDGYLHIVGRSKDLIISGGYNIYPKEIELLIDDLEGVNESAVIGVPHSDFGEGVVAVVVPEKGAGLEESFLASSLTDSLARFKQPKRYFIVDELPRNTMGKVQKNELRKQYMDLFSG